MVIALLCALALLVLLTTGKVLVSQHGQLGGSLVRAEFRDATPLAPGMAVRVSGIPAGTVQDVKLTDRGTAEVGLRLARDVPSAHADATAAIRQKDILGDSYVELSLGRARGALRGTIPVAHTVTRPRLDEVFSTFRKPERDGLQALAVELGTALDRRGTDLNAAILHLRGGMGALDDLLGELDGQGAALRTVVSDAQRVTGQVAAARPALETGLRALRRTLDTTAQHGRALDATLTGAPATMATASGTLDRVARTAGLAQPLARELAAAGPQLSGAAKQLAPWAKDAAAAMKRVAPLLSTMKGTLRVAAPVVADLKSVDPVDMLLPAAKLLSVLSPVFADGAKALFGATSYGHDPKGQTGLGAVAVERGDQPTSPGTDPARTWVRTGVVVTCEMFGVPIAPGCLAKILGSTTNAVTHLVADQAPKGGGGGEAKSEPSAPATSPAPSSTAAPTTAVPPGTIGIPGVVTITIPGTTSLPQPAPSPAPPQGSGGPSSAATLLDYLLGGK